MKKTVLALGLALATLVGSGARLLAQQPASGTTRVAIVNVGLVFTKYHKAKTYKDQMEKLLEPYQTEGKKLKKEMLDWTEFMKSPKFDPKERDRYDAGIRNNQRKLEDLEMQVRKLAGKTQEDQITYLFKEVNTAVQSYAQANGIHVVLAYGEQTEGDAFNFGNINRKMQGMDLGSCTPLFHVPGVDISEAVAEMLNSAYQRAGGAAVPGTTTSNQK